MAAPDSPPGQYVREDLKDMGGEAGPGDYSSYRLRVYGEVEQPLEFSYAELLKPPQTDQTCDVHCVTRWSMPDSKWQGVRLADLADKVKVRSTALARDLRGGARLHLQRAAAGRCCAPTCWWRTALVEIRWRISTAAPSAPWCCGKRFPEERQVAYRGPVQRPRRARLLGEPRLQQPRQPLARGAVWLMLPVLARAGSSGGPPSARCTGTPGTLAVGLTVVYVFSGLAVNHVADRIYNFQTVPRRPPGPRAAAQR